MKTSLVLALLCGSILGTPAWGGFWKLRKAPWESILKPSSAPGKLASQNCLPSFVDSPAAQTFSLPQVETGFYPMNLYEYAGRNPYTLSYYYPPITWGIEVYNGGYSEYHERNLVTVLLPRMRPGRSAWKRRSLPDDIATRFDAYQSRSIHALSPLYQSILEFTADNFSRRKDPGKLRGERDHPWRKKMRAFMERSLERFSQSAYIVVRDPKSGVINLTIRVDRQTMWAYTEAGKRQDAGILEFADFGSIHRAPETEGELPGLFGYGFELTDIPLPKRTWGSAFKNKTFRKRHLAQIPWKYRGLWENIEVFNLFVVGATSYRRGLSPAERQKAMADAFLPLMEILRDPQDKDMPFIVEDGELVPALTESVHVIYADTSAAIVWEKMGFRRLDVKKVDDEGMEWHLLVAPGGIDNSFERIYQTAYPQGAHDFWLNSNWWKDMIRDGYPRMSPIESP